jgi:acyl carrier protein
MTAAREIERWILHWLSDLVGPNVAPTIDPQEPFFTYGVDSLALVRLGAQLSEWLGETVSDEMMFDHPTPRELAEFLAGRPSDSS